MFMWLDNISTTRLQVHSLEKSQLKCCVELAVNMFWLDTLKGGITFLKPILIHN